MSELLLVQLSDLHIAGDDEQPSNLPSQEAASLEGRLRLMMGFKNITRSLPNRLRGLSRYLIVAGDLTVRGTNESLDESLGFLDGYTNGLPRSVRPVRVGLGESPQRILKIPGNHDHWRGEGRVFPFLPKYDPQLSARLQTPVPMKAKSRDGTLQVDIVGLDSCSGFEHDRIGYTPTQKGALSSGQIESLRGDKPQVVVVHHDLKPRTQVIERDPRGRLRRAVFPFPLIRGREELIEQCAESGIVAALTGHRHTPTWARRTCPDNAAATVMELRSPAAAGPVKAGGMGFLVHHLKVAGEELTWTCYLFLLAARQKWPVRVDLTSKKGTRPYLVRFAVPFQRERSSLETAGSS